jgi:5-methylcytosine-specific restriction endonuclease McrA
VKCNRAVEFEDGVVDHTVPHSRGGSTSLENGRYSHKTCNISRGIRDNFDPAKECYFFTSKGDDNITLAEQAADL